MSSTQNALVHDNEGLGENSSIGVSVTPINPEEVPNMEPVDISSHNALNADSSAEPIGNKRREARSSGQGARGMGYGGISLQVIFEMPQAQQIAIAQLQSRNKTPSVAKHENIRHTEPEPEESNGNNSGTDPTIMRMLEELTKRIKAGEKKIEENNKKVETYNSRVDQIPGAPPVLKGLDAKKFTCGIKGNDLNDDEIESVLLKKFGETLSKGAMIWYHNLAPNFIDSLDMLVDTFVKAHVGSIKVATRKSDVFKVQQRNDEMLREFMSKFQWERMELTPVSDDWAVQAFMQGLNERSLIASRQLKQNLIKYRAMTWSDVHNHYQSKIMVEDDQLGASSGSVRPNKFTAKPPRDTNRESRFNKRY
ncbi:uncharacterized protein [Nicotiana sylvestris]|uniref:uncharacterized protein n=1 Tax=Nicotiana sylvestris TaxID=4096 RepID=UPI00388C8A78